MDGDALVRGLIADGLDQHGAPEPAPTLRHFAAACPQKEDALAIRECVSPVSLWQPKHIVPSAWYQHAPFAWGREGALEHATERRTVGSEERQHPTATINGRVADADRCSGGGASGGA